MDSYNKYRALFAFIILVVLDLILNVWMHFLGYQISYIHFYTDTQLCKGTGQVGLEDPLKTIVWRFSNKSQIHVLHPASLPFPVVNANSLLCWMVFTNHGFIPIQNWKCIWTDGSGKVSFVILQIIVWSSVSQHLLPDV